MTEVKIPDDGGATMIERDVGGYLVPNFPGRDAATLKQIFNNIPTLSMRDDDIMLCSFGKTGTNWLYEILSMMKAKSAESIQLNKVSSMIETQPPEDMEELPSPRIMNTHLKPGYLPGDLKKKQIRTVLILRNPKDAAVSMYNHMKGMRIYEYDGEWKDWLLPYTRGAYEYGSYPDYLWAWQKTIEEGVGFPLHVMYYEDLKMDGITEIDKLERFLHFDLDAETERAIHEACEFERMKREKKQPKVVEDVLFKEGYGFLRKGQIGDWKNWFTAQQNEMFDQIWERETQGLNFTFKYDIDTL